jgi:carboxyl-terminal processing protease
MLHTVRRFFLLLTVGFPLFLSAAPQPLKIDDVPKVLERLFSFHIENKELNPTLLRRSFKLYIEQFDPDKSYLLEKEVVPFLTLSDAEAQKIIGRLRRGDYSDYWALNQLLQQAALRSQRIRQELSAEMAQADLSYEHSSHLPPAHYCQSLSDLQKRVQGKMARFYLFHRARTALSDYGRRLKVYQLFDRKLKRFEAQYLFIHSSTGAPLPPDRQEHYFALRLLKSLAKSLDTHTAFFSPEEAYEMRLALEKQFEGVGVVLAEGIDGVIISDLIRGSPAHTSGKIQVNDRLIAIDGRALDGIPFEEVLEILKKKGRDELLLSFVRANPSTGREEQFQVSLRKQPIVMKEERIETSFEQYGNGVIGKIVLHSFYETSDGMSSEKDIKEALRQFRQHGELLGLVLDLRENSGGFLSQAVKVAGLFISNGVVVISKYGQGEVHYLRNIVGKSAYNGPLVVLTSKMSASASEIVAQALQDYGVALVVGDERTFGKGSIQYQNVTDEKADQFFKVTVGRYYTVSGHSTQIEGVHADIVVPTQFAPYNIGERYLEYPLPPDHVDPAYVDPLSDLDEKAQRLFRAKYLPYLQRVVSFWKKMLPTLQKNSAARLAKDPLFQALLRKQEKVRERLATLPANTVDEPLFIGLEDIQMGEAVNIIKDMIYLETEARQAAHTLLPTGSD